METKPLDEFNHQKNRAASSVDRAALVIQIYACDGFVSNQFYGEHQP
jgi:hypothetical protein